MFGLVVVLLIGAAAAWSWLHSLGRLLERLERRGVNRGRLDYYQ